MNSRRQGDRYTQSSIAKLEENASMPTFRRLRPEELAALRKPRGRSIDLSEYRQFLEGLSPGEGGELALGPDEPKRTVKRRLTTAAKQMGKTVVYRRSEGDVVRFEVQGR
jgi:hypothetical protein